MPDPIGAAGTAVGIVSLGLQVYSSLKQYLEDFNSRDGRVTSALAYLEQLKATVDVIDAATQSLQAQHQAPADRVLSCLRSCMVEMQSFQGRLKEFMTSHQTGVKGKIKEIKKKLEYPFEISGIDEIEKGLKRIVDLLSLATQGLGLHSHLTISTNVNALGAVINSQANVLARVSTSSDAIQRTNASNAIQLTAINSSVQPLESMLHALDSVTKTRFDSFESQVQTNHTITNARLDVLESRTEANTQSMTEMLNLLQHLGDSSRFMGQEAIGKRLVGALVSKPSLLRDAHKSYDTQKEVIKAPLNPHMAASPCIASETPEFCDCRSWRRVKQRDSRWHPFHFFSKEVAVLTHRPTCPHFTGHSSQRLRTFGITYLGLQRLLSVACSISLSLDSGAGGISIGPIFRYSSMVDASQSPPFRMISILLKAVEHVQGSYPYSPDNVRKVTTDCISWVRVAYDKNVGSPRDVSIDGLTLVDFFLSKAWVTTGSTDHGFDHVYYTLYMLFNFGVASTQQTSIARILRYGNSLPYIKNLGPSLSLVIRKAPECEDQWRATSINLQLYGDLIQQSSELSAAIELELDSICTAFLRRDINALSKVLATGSKQCFKLGQYKLIKSLAELAARWPVGLIHMLEMEPCFLKLNKIKRLFYRVTTGTSYTCKEGLSLLCDGCSCSESAEILLEHGCTLTCKEIRDIFKYGSAVSTKTRHAVLRHLGLWRQKLRDSLWLCESVVPEDQFAMNESTLLDHKARSAVNALRSSGIDLFKKFGLQPGDYRLGCSLHEDCSIYCLITVPEDAQLAFDLGFRDVDVSCEGFTPLCKAVEGLCPLDYAKWLVDHGADYTRELRSHTRRPSQPLKTVDAPNHSIVHKIFRLLSSSAIHVVKSWILSLVGNPCFPHFSRSSYYDGCSCACLSSHEGCSPFALYANNTWDSYERGFLPEVIDAIHVFAAPIEQYSTLADSLIRYLTFKRLDIRHTCCASIRINRIPYLSDNYGSDFDELREEDERRVHQLNELVVDFMNQYSNSVLSLKDFIDGPWAEQMDRIEAEERKRTWTAQEKDVLLSIGVFPEDEETETNDSIVELVDEDDEEDMRLQPEYWNRQFEIIVNGGRSKEEKAR